MISVLELLAADRDRPAFHDRTGTVTAGQAADTVYRTARALRDRGCGPGGAVALCGPISTRMYLLAHAVELTGAAQVEIPVAMSAAEQARLAAECGAALAVADSDHVHPAAIRALAERMGAGVLTLAAASAGADLGALAETYSARPLVPRAEAGAPNRIVLTGGTTGRAKPVLRRHPRSPRPQAPWLWELLDGGDGPARVLKTERFTGFGRLLGDATLLHGGEFVTLPEFDADAVLAAIAERGVTHAVLAPHQLRILLDHRDARAANLPSLRGVICATAATGPALLRRAVDRLGPIVYPTYGQTEAGHIAWLTPRDYADWDPRVVRSCGRPVPRVDVQVRDTAGRVLGANERGRVWVRTPALMDEYLNRPEETAGVLHGGWLDTGDIGLLDGRGYLTLLGRAGEAMRISGTTVFASEVDFALQEHPDVLESATYDVAGADGASLHTAVVLTKGARATGTELNALLDRSLHPKLLPSSFAFVPRLPLTYAHEPCRDTLRRWHAQSNGPRGRE